MESSPLSMIDIHDKLTTKVLTPTKALVVVDVQNDFIDGTLAVKQCPAGQDGADVVPVINSLIDHSEKSTNCECLYCYH